jgi:hypothetical protein
MHVVIQYKILNLFRKNSLYRGDKKDRKISETSRLALTTDIFPPMPDWCIMTKYLYKSIYSSSSYDKMYSRSKEFAPTYMLKLNSI